MAYLAFAITINTRAGKSVNFADLVSPAAVAVPDRAAVAGLAFQQIDLQADVFNTTPIIVGTTPGGPGLTLGPGGVGRLTLGPFGGSPLRLSDLYGAGTGVVRITGVVGATGVDPLAAPLPEPHHTTHEPGGTDALVNVAWTDLVNTFTARQVFDARVDVNGLANLGLLQVAGPVDLEGAVVVRGNATLEQGLTVVGPGTVQGALVGQGGVTASGNQGVLRLQDTGGPSGSRTYRFIQYNNGALRLEATDEADVAKFMVLWVEPTQGIVTFSAYTTHSGGAYFPLTSSNPVVLDHYEEGTWTPTLVGFDGGAGTAYVDQKGTYTRIGNLVYVTFWVEVTTADWTSGNVLLAGLPFVNEATSYGVGKLDYWLLTGSVIDVKLHLQPDQVRAYIVFKDKASALGHDGIITTTHVQPGSKFRGAMTYRTTT